MASDPEMRQIAAALRTGVGLLLRRLRQVQVDGELTLAESSALAKLERQGPSTSSALAKQEQISPQSMGATLSALEARGLIKRSPDPADGRRVVFSLTKDGAKARRSKNDARTEQLAKALSSGFTAAELAQLKLAAPLLERLANNI
jgi:DNA-binding MarR family transcriptional regulator